MNQMNLNGRHKPDSTWLNFFEIVKNFLPFSIFKFLSFIFEVACFNLYRTLSDSSKSSINRLSCLNMVNIIIISNKMNKNMSNFQ